jgi:hypothetical protein
MHDWKLEPAVPADRFTFSPPQGAVKWEALPVDEAGELAVAGESK